MVSAIRAKQPQAKLVYNNSPSFNWTLSFREQVYQEWVEAGKDVSNYPDPAKDPKGLMDEKFDDSELALEADKYIQNFQKDASREAGIFHHLITLPTYHETALGTSVLSEGYFYEMPKVRHSMPEHSIRFSSHRAGLDGYEEGFPSLRGEGRLGERQEAQDRQDGYACPRPLQRKVCMWRANDHGLFPRVYVQASSLREMHLEHGSVRHRFK